MVFGLLMRILSFIGSFPVYVAASLLFLSPINLFASLIAGLVISSVIIFVLRIFFKGSRPDKNTFEHKMASMHASKGVIKKLKEAYLKMESRSFASAHVARIACFGFIYYSVYPSLEAVIIFLGLAIIVAFARLYLKRHTRTDVVIGFLLGALSGYLALILFSNFGLAA